MTDKHPFQYVLEARALVEQLNRRLMISAAPMAETENLTVQADAAPVGAVQPETAPRGGGLEVTRAIVEEAHQPEADTVAPEVALHVDLEMCFPPEPDEVLEEEWLAPVLASAWAQTGDAPLERDGFSEFLRGEHAATEAAEGEILEEPKAAAGSPVEAEPIDTQGTSQDQFTAADEQSPQPHTAAGASPPFSESPTGKAKLDDISREMSDDMAEMIANIEQWQTTKQAQEKAERQAEAPPMAVELAVPNEAGPEEPSPAVPVETPASPGGSPTAETPTMDGRIVGKPPSIRALEQRVAQAAFPEKFTSRSRIFAVAAMVAAIMLTVALGVDSMVTQVFDSATKDSVETQENVVLAGLDIDLAETEAVPMPEAESDFKPKADNLSESQSVSGESVPSTSRSPIIQVAFISEPKASEFEVLPDLPVIEVASADSNLVSSGAEDSSVDGELQEGIATDADTVTTSVNGSFYPAYGNDSTTVFAKSGLWIMPGDQANAPGYTFQADPQIWSYGLEWTPIPLISTGLHQNKYDIHAIGGYRYDFVNSYDESVVAERPIEFITSEDLAAEQQSVAAQTSQIETQDIVDNSPSEQLQKYKILNFGALAHLKESVQKVFTSTAWAAESAQAAPMNAATRPDAQKTAPTIVATAAQKPTQPEKTETSDVSLIAQVGGSFKKILASPTWATVSEELRIAPSAGDGEESEEENEVDGTDPIYTVEASPDHLTVGRAADVIFTLKYGGRPVEASDLEVRFESDPAFPNLRSVARQLDDNGSFTVKGLIPGQPGATALGLLIDDNIYVEAPVVVAAAKPSMAPKKPKSAPASFSVESLPTTPPVAATGLPSTAEITIPPVEWTIVPGLLRGQLEAWSARAGYQLVWEARNDFEMFSQARFQEDYINAVRKLFTAMHDQGNPLRVTVYQGNRVLKVTEE